MVNEEILKKIVLILKDVFDDDNLIVTNSTSSSDIEEWDSLAQISIIAAVENEFNINLSITDAKHASNIGELVELISKKIN